MRTIVAALHLYSTSANGKSVSVTIPSMEQHIAADIKPFQMVDGSSVQKNVVTVLLIILRHINPLANAKIIWMVSLN